MKDYDLMGMDVSQFFKIQQALIEQCGKAGTGISIEMTIGETINVYKESKRDKSVGSPQLLLDNGEKENRVRIPDSRGNDSAPVDPILQGEFDEIMDKITGKKFPTCMKMLMRWEATRAKSYYKAGVLLGLTQGSTQNQMEKYGVKIVKNEGEVGLS